MIYRQGLRFDLRPAVFARLFDDQILAQVEGDRRVRVGPRGRHRRPRQHMAVHVHVGHMLWRRPAPAHVHNSQRDHQTHAAKLLLEVAQLITALW